MLLGLLFASGFAALVHQVLWARQLSLLLGSTAQGAAPTVVIFFAGLAWGGVFWGRRTARLPHALAGFGWLEVAVGLTALGHVVLMGGTLPMVVQHVMRTGDRLGVPGSRLYAVNTAGALDLLPRHGDRDHRRRRAAFRRMEGRHRQPLHPRAPHADLLETAPPGRDSYLACLEGRALAHVLTGQEASAHALAGEANQVPLTPARRLLDPD